MRLSLGRDELFQYINRQLDYGFPDGYRLEGDDVKGCFDLALERLEYCFQYINVPAYSDNNGQTFFSHLHSDQYAHFLYYFSNTLWLKTQKKELCDKLICLNKALNGFFYSYKGILPDVFFFGHPVGSVIGNADYSNYLVIFQNVTINTAGTAEVPAPKLGKGLFCAAGAKIIGDKPIGDRVSIGVDALVYDNEVIDDSVVERNAEGECIIRPRRAEHCMAQQYFNIDIDSNIKSYTI